MAANGTDIIQRTDKPYDLIDGASPAGFELMEDVENRKRIIKNPEFPIEERLEAFEDVIDSEVGDTTLYRARNIEREIGFRQIYLKYEGGNPTGTQKDRIAFAQVLDALRRGFDTISLATCGNYGAACALAASISGINCKIFVPQNYDTKRIDEMTSMGANVTRVDGDYEQAVETASSDAKKNENYDANPGGDNVMLQFKAYGEIAYEIYDELRDAPKIIAVPVSNGTTLAGIHKGFVSLYRRGKTSRIPRFIAGSSFKKNPIVQAVKLNKETCEDLIPDRIKESKINEPLINWHSIDGDFALQAIKSSDGWAEDATDKEMLSYSKMIRDREGISVIPASTAGLVALVNYNKQTALSNDKFVVIITGRK